MKRFWLLVGSEENWERALAENIWGVTEINCKTWEKLKSGDVALFYVKRPVKGVIGVGVIKTKFKQDKPLWRQEIESGKVIWPYRFEFEVEYALPLSDWRNKAVKLKGLEVPTIRGINPIRDLRKVERLLVKLDEEWNTNLTSLVKPRPIAKPKSIHEKVKDKLMELGRFEGFIAEKEYPFPDIRERLDVVWRRVPASVPTYVFEVQIGGNLHQALTKLKHAHDIWNSNIFLVIKDEDQSRVKFLLSGAFHEISEVLKVLTVKMVNELYDIQRRDHELKRRAGLR